MNSFKNGITPEQSKTGMRMAYAAQCCGLVFEQFLCVTAFGALFIKTMGGSDFQAMLITSLWGLTQFVQVIASLRVPPERGKAFLLKCWFYSGIIFAFMLLCAFWSNGRTSIWAFLGFAVFGMFIRSMGSTFWYPLLHDVVPDNRRGRFFGLLRALWNGTLFVCVIAAGLFLGKNPEIWQFQVVFGVALIGVFVRNYFIIRIPTPEKYAISGEKFENWKKYLINTIKRRDVVVFSCYIAVLLLSAGFLAQPMVLYMKHLGFPTRDNAIIYGFVVLGASLSLLASGQLIDRIGTKRVFLMVHLVLCALAFSVIAIDFFAHEYAKVLLTGVFIMSGACMAASHLAVTAQFFHLAPDHGRAFFLSLTNVVATSATCLSPLIAGGILSLVPEGWNIAAFGQNFNIFHLIFAFAGISLIFAILILRCIDDVRPKHL